jgi:uncharacterized protein
MTTIAIFGGTGYAGGAIRDEALRRGHTVITVSRTEAEAAGKAGLISRATGRYRVGGDVLLTDADGNSTISGADYAKAFVDEIEQPAHRRQRFSVAY